MVNIEEMKQIIHEEEMAKIRAQTEVYQKEIEKKKAKDEKLFRLKNHWTGQKATLIDVSNSITPPRSKVLEECDKGDRLLEAHYNGLMDAFKIRIGVIALLWLVYVL